MDGGGFEPPKQFAADLQSVPFGHSGICPFTHNILCELRGQDLNLRPSGYEPDELPDCSIPRYMQPPLLPVSQCPLLVNIMYYNSFVPTCQIRFRTLLFPALLYHYMQS